MSEPRLNDETLSTYLDGELDAGERARIEAALAADPAARARLEVLRSSTTLAREAFDARLREPVPPSLVAAVRAAARKSAAAPRRTAWLAWLRSLLTMPAPALAAAAGLTLVIGAVGYLVGRFGTAPADALALLEGRAEAVRAALDTRASGASFTVGSARVELRATYRVDEATLCRELRVQWQGDARRSLVCGGPGEWRVVAVAPEGGAGGGYRLASGASGPLESLLAEMGAAAPLAADAERAALARAKR